MSTQIYEFLSFEYGVRGWDGVLRANIDKIEQNLNSRASFIAGSTVTTRRPVALQSDGTIRNAYMPTYQPVIGIALNSASAAGSVLVQRAGIVEWDDYDDIITNPGDLIYAGVVGDTCYLTAVKPGSNIQLLGFAISQTEIFLTGNLYVE